MSTRNLGYYYNREYYKKLITKDSKLSDQDGEPSDELKGRVLEANETLRNFQVPDIGTDYSIPRPSQCFLEQLPGYCAFELQTTYPGLLSGTGLAHHRGAQGGCGLGFSFDYTTGLPSIPGSSVKGVLRSAFNLASYVQALFPGLDTAALQKEIFGESAGNDDYTAPESHDVFLDAYPVRSDGIGCLMELDNITPHHKGKLGVLADPVPITMVKVRAGVVYRFCFLLRDGKTVKAEQKCEAFKRILMDMGIGAKTDVGYGRLVEKTDNPPRPRQQRNAQPETRQNAQNNARHAYQQNAQNNAQNRPLPPRQGGGTCQKCGGRTGLRPNGVPFLLCRRCEEEKRALRQNTYRAQQT